MIARLVSFSVLLCGAVSSTVAPVEAPPQPTPRETVRVHLVQVPILAMDRQGSPVKDLKAEEMVVRHGGRKVRIAYLEPLRAVASPTVSLPGVRLEVEALGGSGSTSEAGAAGERLLLFLDVQNDDKLRHEDAEQAITSFLQGMPSTFHVGVSSFDGELHLDLPFTGDRSAVLSAVRSAWSRPGSPHLDLQAKVRALISRFEDCVRSGNEFARVADERCLRDTSREYVEEVRPASLDYLRALEGAISYMGGLPGNKLLLAVSHGVAVDPSPVVLEALRGVIGNTEQLQDVQADLGFGDSPQILRNRVTSLAVGLHVALHFVDRTSPPHGDGAASRSARIVADASPLAASHRAAQDDLKELAAATGGTFHASTRLLPGLQGALAMQEGSYEVGYYLDEDLVGERMDKLAVETTRRGVRIVHRAGRLAASSAPAVGPGPRIRVGDSPRPPTVEGNVVRVFQIACDPKRMGYRVSEAEAAGNFTLYVALKDESGRALADSYHFFNHAYPGDLWESKDVGDLLINGWFEVPPGRYQLGAVLRNTDTSWEGEVLRALAVERMPATAQETPGAKP